MDVYTAQSRFPADLHDNGSAGGSAAHAEDTWEKKVLTQCALSFVSAIRADTGSLNYDLVDLFKVYPFFEAKKQIDLYSLVLF